MDNEVRKERLFVKEEFIEWAAEAFAEAMKRATKTIEWLERREFDLSTARDAKPISIIPPQGFDSGNYIKIISCNGEASLRLDTQGDEEFDATKQTELKLLFHQVYITNTAQSDKKLVLCLGRGDFGFPESPEKRERKTLIASTTTILGVGGIYTSDWFDTLNYSRIALLSYADQASATNGVEIIQSTDGENEDYSTQQTALAGTGLAMSVELVARYVRIRYTNGSVAHTAFRLAALARSMP